MVLGSFQCLGVLLIRIIAGHGPIVLAVDASGVWIFFLLSIICLSPSLWEMA